MTPVLISDGASWPKNGRKYFLLSMGAVYCVLGFNCGTRFSSHASATWLKVTTGFRVVECRAFIHVYVPVPRDKVENQFIAACADGFEPWNIDGNPTVLDFCNLNDVGATSNGSANINSRKNFRK